MSNTSNSIHNTYHSFEINYYPNIVRKIVRNMNIFK